MKLIVISSPLPVKDEIEIIASLFENGLDIFHVHKPSFTEKEIQNYIQQFPEKYQNRIFLHSQFPKFHSLKELEDCKEKYEYAFLSPIFDSISKSGYKSKFGHELYLPITIGITRNKLAPISAIRGKNIIALGGIDEDKIKACYELGFAGVAVLGAIWQSENPTEKFKKIKQLCHAERSEASVLDSSLRSE